MSQGTLIDAIGNIITTHQNSIFVADNLPACDAGQNNQNITGRNIYSDHALVFTWDAKYKSS
jgi:hypothetical protein